jgi:hypothetical protein
VEGRLSIDSGTPSRRGAAYQSPHQALVGVSRKISFAPQSCN